MQLISQFNKRFRFILCVIDIFSKYAWVALLKDKKGISIVNAFQKILKESKRKPNKIWVDKGSEFYNNSFKKWLKDNDIEMYSIHNEGKSVVAERIIRILKNKMTSLSKNVGDTRNAGAEPNPDVPRTAAQLLAARQADERNKGVTFKNCAPFTKCISRITIQT